MAATTAILTGVGALASGAASMAGAFSGPSRPYYSLEQQEDYQKHLMKYQQELNDSSQVDAENRQYARQLQYSDPAFIKQRALNAGVNPSSLLGSTASLSSAVGGNVSIPSAPANSFSDSTGARVAHSLNNAANSVLGFARFANELSEYKDQREARQTQLDALREDVHQKQLHNRLLGLDIDEKSWNASIRGFRWAEEQKNWQRSDKAFTRQMEESAYRMMESNRRYNLDVRKQDFAEMDSNRNYGIARRRANDDHAMAELNFAMNTFDLNQKEWRQAFYDKFGYYPPQGTTAVSMFKEAASSITGLFDGVTTPLYRLFHRGKYPRNSFSDFIRGDNGSTADYGFNRWLRNKKRF